MKAIPILCMLLLCIPRVIFSQSGPGGVGANANLAFWLDANAHVYNSPVDSWLDVSGNNTITDVNGDPIRIPSLLNGRSVVRFDGNGDEVYTGISINAIENPLLTVISVYIPRVAYAGSVWGEDNGEWDRFTTDSNLHPALSSTISAGYQPDPLPHPCVNVPNLFVTDNPTLSTVTYDEDTYLQTHAYVNGANAATFTSTAADYETSGYSNFYVGAIGSNQLRFNGDIAEVIVFRTSLAQAHRVIIENYLAAKYGLTLLANDIYTEDNLGYDYDVAGIGRLGATSQTSSRGTGIITISNANNLGNNEYLMWGHDNGTLQAINASDVPTGVQARSGRVWKVSEVNQGGVSVDVGSITINFNLTGLGSVTASDLRLLVDLNNNGIFADDAPIAGATSVGNNEYEFSNVTAIADNLRFTFGTINTLQTPLPVKLKYFTAYTDLEGVELKWQSVTEKNVSEYIVTRSSTGKNWTPIATLLANGPGEYKVIDGDPLEGNSYYMLSARDEISNDESCGVISIQRAKKKSFTAYPNPTTTSLTIMTTAGSDFRIFNFIGEDCTRFTNVINESEETVLIDVRDLPPGHYYLLTKNGDSLNFVKETR